MGRWTKSNPDQLLSLKEKASKTVWDFIRKTENLVLILNEIRNHRILIHHERLPLLDDMIVHSKKDQEHWDHLAVISNEFRKHRLLTRHDQVQFVDDTIVCSGNEQKITKLI